MVIQQTLAFSKKMVQSTLNNQVKHAHEPLFHYFTDGFVEPGIYF